MQVIVAAIETIINVFGISFAVVMGVKAGDVVTDYLYRLYDYFKYKNKPIPPPSSPSPLPENWIVLVLLLLGVLLLAGLYFRRKPPRK